jgi:hypothetical protein
MSPPSSDLSPRAAPAILRRAFLGRYAGGLGAYALAHLLALEGRLQGAESAAAGAKGPPLAPKPPHHRPRAKAVICLFQHGGPSQMDLFDPKPELGRRHGQKHEGELEVHFHTQKGNLLGSPFAFRRCGRSGMELSEILPHTGSIADEITLVRSMATESVDHEAALRLIHTGKVQAGRPTWGSWVLYGLGNERQELPAYVVLSDPGGLPIDQTRNWSSGWLPAIYQGTQFNSSGSPVFNLSPPAAQPPGARRRQLQLLAELNREHLRRHPESSELEARIANYELAARMQAAAPAAIDISGESPATRRLYGLDDPVTADYGKRCLMARRLVEEGVRFVQVFLSGQPWDTHSKNAESLKGLCARTDRPSAALVKDLKSRGLLESTIVLWTGEFGRLPIAQGTDGRDHNRHGFSLWLAGGGFKAGHVHGASDEIGYRAVEDVVTVFDLHATLLHALGLDHERLTFPHDGREDSLTDTAVSRARVVRGLLA